MSESRPETPVDPADGEQGLLPHAPGPAGSGTGTDAGADPAAPEQEDSDA